MPRGEITSMQVDGREFEVLPGQKPWPHVEPVRCRCGSEPAIQDQTEIWRNWDGKVHLTMYYVRCLCGRVAERNSFYRNGCRVRWGYGTYDEAANAWNLLQARMAWPETGDQRWTELEK